MNYWIYLLAIAIVLIVSSLTGQAAFGVSKKITEAQAVRRAEQYIAENGYTAAIPKKKKLAPESLDWGHSYESELKLRHDSLQSKAYGVFEGNRMGAGWSVVFKYSKSFLDKVPGPKATIDAKTGLEIAPPMERETGRVVVMDAYGNKCMVMHKELFLDVPFKRLQAESRDKNRN